MAIEDIKKELEKRFAKPLGDFYKRKIIYIGFTELIYV